MRKSYFALCVLGIFALSHCSRDRNPVKVENGGVAQREYFYYNPRSGEKIFLQLDRSQFVVSYADSATEGEIAALHGQYHLTVAKKFLYNVYLLQPPDRQSVEAFFTPYGDSLAQGFGREPLVKYANPVFWDGGKFQILTDGFYVDFGASISEEEIRGENARHGVEIVEKMGVRGNRYYLKVTQGSEYNALEMANFYHESALTQRAFPDLREEVSRGWGVGGPSELNGWVQVWWNKTPPLGEVELFVFHHTHYGDTLGKVTVHSIDGGFEIPDLPEDTVDVVSKSFNYRATKYIEVVLPVAGGLFDGGFFYLAPAQCEDYVPDVVFVDFKEWSTEEEALILIRESGCQIKYDWWSRWKTYVLKIPEGPTQQEIIEYFIFQPVVKHASPDYYTRPAD